MIRLTINVSDVSVVESVFTTLKLEWSTDEEFNTINTLPDIALTGASTYYYDHVAGQPTYWYRSRYWSPVNGYSSYSDPVRGEEAELFHNVTYPKEIYLGTSDETIVDKIRVLIGDQKELRREYIDDCYAAVHDDGHTFELDQKGWPVYVSLDEDEKTSASDPYVDGWRYLTFSGTISTTTGVLDIYYNTFRWSDQEIIEHYSNAMIPPGLTSTTVTTDHLILQAAIDLLEAENWRDYIENGAVIADSDTRWDPSPGYRARESAIKRLQKRLDDLVKQYMLTSDGYRLD